jgi:ubiquinol-cytochrome c reductase cytochrome c subunit
MKRLLVVLPVLVVVGVAFAFSGNHTKRYAPPGILAVGQPVTGQEWFQRDCAWCHGNAGQGTPRGPDLIGDRNGGAMTDFMLRTGRMPLQDATDIVKEGAPAYPPAVIEKIVAYVVSLGGKGPDIPVVDTAAGALPEGEELFQANCAACHSATGIGGTLTAGQGDTPTLNRSGNQVPGLQRSTPTEIAEAMRAGPGTMPVFGKDTFSDQEVNSIIRYVLFIRSGQNRGGADLGRVGPVSEGAVAWIVGLGALLVFARWIGKSVRQHG